MTGVGKHLGINAAGHPVLRVVRRAIEQEHRGQQAVVELRELPFQDRGHVAVAEADEGPAEDEKE